MSSPAPAPGPAHLPDARPPSDQSETPRPDGRLRLVTFGRLALVDEQGRDEPSLTTRRRKLALLAYLALQRRPVPRGVVQEMFWGRRDEDRARRSLSDALSHLRRVLSRDLVATYASDLALRPEALPEVDALELEEAARAGDHQRVIDLYWGPFLQGVFVEGSTNFEDWSTERRRHFAELFATACEGQCLALARARSWSECAMVARKWLDERPDSENAALYYLNALKAPGSRDALREALDAFETLRARLARDFEEKPARTVRDLALQIEIDLAATPAAPPLVARAPSTNKPADAARIEPAPPSVSTLTLPRTRARAQYGSRFAMGALIVALLVGVGLVATPLRRSIAGLRTVTGTRQGPSRPVVAVLPVGVSADSSLRWLADGLPAMIAAKLAHVEGVEVINAAGGARSDSARRATPPGATIAATGVVTRRLGQLLFELVVHGPSGEVLAHRSLTASNAVDLADAAAVQVLLAAAVKSDGALLGDLETSSIEAYQHFMKARRAYAAGDEAGAVRAADEAIRLDSGFVSALFFRYRMAKYDPAVASRLGRLIAIARPRASEFDRFEVDVHDAFLAGDHARARLLASTFADRFSHSDDAYQTYFGILLSHGRLGEAMALSTKRIAQLESELSPNHPQVCTEYAQRANLQRTLGKLEVAVRDANVVLARCPYRADLAMHAGWVLLAAGDVRGAERVLQRIRAISGDTPRLLTSRVLMRSRRYDAADSLAQTWIRSTNDEIRSDGYDLATLVARERGQFERAQSLLEIWKKTGVEFVPQFVFDQDARLGRKEELRRFVPSMLLVPAGFVTLSGDSLPFTGSPVRGWTWHRALYADALVRLGDTITAKAYADSLRDTGGRSYFGRDWTVHHHVRGIVAARAKNWPVAVRELEASLWGPRAWTRTNVELARAYLALGRTSDAVAILRDAYGANLESQGRYVPFSELDEQMSIAFSAAGQADSAAVYAGYVRRAWAAADPAVRARLR